MTDTHFESMEFLSDTDLLEDFKLTQDPNSFGELVRRYSGLVFGVCRRITSNRHDAEDAFQATFLVLSQKAKRIRDPKMLSSWLYGVAFRVSIRLTKKRAKGKMTDVDQVTVSDDPFEKVNHKFVDQKTDEALQQLPEKLRTPMVMRYVMGKSNAEVAESLNISVSAIEGRLKRAKSRLRLQLTKHGITLGAALIAISVSQQQCEAQLSADLIELVSNVSSFENQIGTEATSEVSKIAIEEVYAMSVLHSTKFVAAIAGCVIILGACIGIPFANALAEEGGGKNNRQNQSAVNVNVDPISSFQASNEVDVEISLVDANQTNTSAPQVRPRTSSIDNRTLSANEVKILDKLEQDTRIEFFGETLGGAVSYLSDFHELNIIIDYSALDDIGESIDSPVQDRRFSGVPLKDALEIILDDLDLTFTIKNKLLMITSHEEAEQNVETRVYNYDSELPVQPEELLEIITTHVQPESWSEVGGQGSISVFETGFVIRQTFRAHQDIHELLSQLRKNAQLSKSKNK